MNDAGWLKDWCSKHVNETFYEDKEQAASLASRALIDAKDKGIEIEKALEDLGYDDLESYMLFVLNQRADEEVDRLASKDR